MVSASLLTSPQSCPQLELQPTSFLFAFDSSTKEEGLFEVAWANVWTKVGLDVPSGLLLLALRSMKAQISSL